MCVEFSGFSVYKILSSVSRDISLFPIQVGCLFFLNYCLVWNFECNVEAKWHECEFSSFLVLGGAFRPSQWSVTSTMCFSCFLFVMLKFSILISWVFFNHERTVYFFEALCLGNSEGKTLYLQLEKEKTWLKTKQQNHNQIDKNCVQVK